MIARLLWGIAIGWTAIASIVSVVVGKAIRRADESQAGVR